MPILIVLAARLTIARHSSREAKMIIPEKRMYENPIDLCKPLGVYTAAPHAGPDCCLPDMFLNESSAHGSFPRASLTLPSIT